MIAYGLLIPIDDYSVGMLVPHTSIEVWRNLITEEERNALDRENERQTQELYG
jgi:hypothetical protein